MNDDSPVFIAASVRSGSTMLKLMLDHHPEIVNPGECDFLFDFVTDGGRMPDTIDYKNALQLNRIYQAKGLKLDEKLSYPEVMTSFLGQFCADTQKLTMNVHRSFHRIPYVFPNARYIYLNRDPRDVASSCVVMGWAGHVYYGVDIWKEAADSWERLKQGLEQKQYLEIRFEDLLDDVEGGLTEICSFLGLKYSELMLSYPESENYDLPDRKLCYQWRTKLSKAELQLVEGKVGKDIVRNGYELSEHESRSPGLLERALPNLSHKIYRSKFQVKNYGAGHYLLTLLANRLGIVWIQRNCQRRRNEIDRKNLK